MEAQFFTYLLGYLRQYDVNAHYSLPVKSTYPACEIDHKETHAFAEKEVVHFHLLLFFDGISQQSIVEFAQKIERLLENTHHTLVHNFKHAVIKVNGKKQPYHERGKLRQMTLDCTALIR